MYLEQRELFDRCPQCKGRVVTRALLSPDNDDGQEDVIGVNDIIGESLPCPRCGTELVHRVTREWEDECHICHASFDAGHHTAEWQPEKQSYRWWCDACEDALLVLLVGWASPRLARTFWYPLAWGSRPVDFCLDVLWRSRWRRRRAM